jgi:hypothetical protein
MVNTRKGGRIDLLTNHHNRRIVNQPQPEMNPLNPQSAGTDLVAAAQMPLLEHMANTMTETRNAIGDETRTTRMTATTTTTSTTTTSSTPGQAPGIHESQATQIL